MGAKYNTKSALNAAMRWLSGACVVILCTTVPSQQGFSQTSANTVDTAATPCRVAKIFVQALSDRRYDDAYTLLTEARKNSESLGKFRESYYEKHEWRIMGVLAREVVNTTENSCTVYLSAISLAEGNLELVRIDCVIKRDRATWGFSEFKWGKGIPIAIPDDAPLGLEELNGDRCF